MKSTCQRCGRPIDLIPFGQHYKWADERGDWHCGNDPERPVLGHEPGQTSES